MAKQRHGHFSFQPDPLRAYAFFLRTLRYSAVLQEARAAPGQRAFQRVVERRLLELCLTMSDKAQRPAADELRLQDVEAEVPEVDGSMLLRERSSRALDEFVERNLESMKRSLVQLEARCPSDRIHDLLDKVEEETLRIHEAYSVLCGA